MVSAVVFGYHNVGVRCLSVLLAQKIEVKLVVTHSDDEDENIWFDSVSNLASLHGIPVVTPDSPNTEDMITRLRSLNPDFIFSFYYRQILSVPVLETARRGSYNMHGSLLPHYRGRAPVNWALVHGESQTGATLHEMVRKPDAGDIVGQMAVPILPNDTASEVFSKVLVAAELVLCQTLPEIVSGTVVARKMDLRSGSYFGGRKPQDGLIDWERMGAQQIHNLVRAVTNPYPGAFMDTARGRITIWRTLVVADSPNSTAQPSLRQEGGRLLATACDGGVLRIIHAELEGRVLDQETFAKIFGSSYPLP
ncbi:formyl transferase [Aspergillus caelatus]|uniref:Formyl transferase n=2 Tax=Aspergillus subgen. Circumdati TaxID=2720871 RepID=A0A5N7A4C8_9EURO|nr:formyl transferase [Aspergillus caelatus]KAE8364711.1 formyl transferase [Aspergillus caelatus]KAE8421769.1 formyl transferase [Aspergillus pseudocaelatus]